MKQNERVDSRRIYRAAVIGTGRSDFPNQVNNVLVFPGIFRGALDARTRDITDAMKIAAARTISQFAEPGELVPGLLHPDVHHAVAEAVQDAARPEVQGRHGADGS